MRATEDAATRDWARIGRIALEVFTAVLALGMLALVVAPIFMHTDSYGVHDWDQMEAHRYLAVKTIKRYHQFPFWNPYSCGGHTWWGGLESGSSLVSPWLPIYLLAPFPWALRLEVVGAGLLSLVGTWLFAGRFTRSPGLRLIAVAAFALDGRFALQASVGHTWHLYYAWTPWALYFLDRAIAIAPGASSKTAFRDVICLGATLAMMVYTGGIYPLPQTIVMIAIYSLTCAIITRSLRPVSVAVGGGLLSFAFSAPRLLPMIEMLRHYPRLVDSPESMDLGGLIGVFTAKESDPRPPVGPWGWHEFGIYVGWVPFAMMLLALAFGGRARERALRVAGAFALICGLGRFHTYSPWGLMHDHLPIFEAQHVPSRWLYPAALMLVVAAAAVSERWLRRQRRRGLLEVAIMSLAAYVALDVGLEAQRPLVGSFVRHLHPLLSDSVGEFHQERTASTRLRYDGSDWAPPNMPAMVANIGVLACNTFPGFNSYYRDEHDHAPGMGAKAIGDADYHGETYFASGHGRASITSWSPNAVTVSYSGAAPGDLLVLNQNWDSGWHARGARVESHADAIGARVEGGEGTVRFRYTPPFFWLGCSIFVLAIGGLVLFRRRNVLKRAES
ncbi:MAG TPA: hypothetical protein VGH28_24545 [Polyangiaceae bacterium]|jgi:hypothetical protein